MQGNSAGHLSDEALAALDEDGESGVLQAREHLRLCAVCRRRHEESIGLRTMLAQTRRREQPPRRDVVPGALKRLRLRRNAVANVNELFGSIYALVLGFASLLSVGEPRTPRKGASEDDLHG